MCLGFVARISSSEGNSSICLLKIVNTGSAFYSISMGGTLLNGSMLCISVFVHLSFLCQSDTGMMIGSVSRAKRFFLFPLQ